MCVCMREREGDRETERDGDREGEREGERERAAFNPVQYGLSS